jgi:hypothetical protein
VKTIFFALSVLLACVAAQASTYQLPTIFQLTGHVCNQEIVAYLVTGIDSNTGYTKGLVYGQTSCSGGGRGGGNSYEAGCYYVKWSGDVLISPIVEVWRRSSRISIPVSECFGG